MLLTLLEQFTSKWQAFENWEELSDEEVWRHLSSHNTKFSEIFVITEASYRKNLGAFVIKREQVQPFVANYLTSFGERLFNGDVIIVNIDQSTVSAFHHEGVFATFGRTDF